MFPDRETLDVLEDKIGGFQFGYDAYEFPNKAVARVVEGAMAHHREALAGGATEYNIDVPTSYSCPLPYFVSGQTGN